MQADSSRYSWKRGGETEKKKLQIKCQNCFFQSQGLLAWTTSSKDSYGIPISLPIPIMFNNTFSGRNSDWQRNKR